MTTTTVSDPALMLRSMFASTHRAARFFSLYHGAEARYWRQYPCTKRMQVDSVCKQVIFGTQDQSDVRIERDCKTGEPSRECVLSQ